MSKLKAWKPGEQHSSDRAQWQLSIGLSKSRCEQETVTKRSIFIPSHLSLSLTLSLSLIFKSHRKICPLEQDFQKTSAQETKPR